MERRMDGWTDECNKVIKNAMKERKKELGRKEG